MAIKFEEFSVDLERFELNRGGEIVSVEPLIFNLIALLASHPQKLFTKQDLIEQLWPGRVISDSAISSAIKSARKALGDSGDQQRFIQTVRGRGIRFTGKLNNVDKQSTEQITKPESQTHQSSPNDSLIVMPIQSLVVDNENESTVRALPQELEHILRRIPLLELSSESSR